MTRTMNSVAVLLLTGLVAAAHAQFPATPQRRGDSTLQVQVLTEGHTVLDNQALIRVRNLADMEERWETTHLGSQASISGLARGSYSLEVSAVGFQSSSLNVDLRAPVQMLQVVLQLDVKKTVYEAPNMKAISRKAREQCARGIEALQTGNLKEAEKQFRKAVKRAADNAHVNYLVAIVLVKEKQVPQATSFLERAVALDPMHAEALTALGGLRLETKDYVGAANVLERAVAANDRQWRPHLLLANVYLAQEQFGRAREQAEAADSLSNHSAPYAVLVLGQALSGLGKHHEAIAALQRFLVEQPSSPDAPAVRNAIASLEHQETRAAAQPAAVTSISLAARASPMLTSVAPTWGPAEVDSVTPSVASGVQCPAQRVFAGVTQSVTDLVDNLDRFSALRTQVHQQLNLLGDPVARQTRKSRYLASISHVPGGLELNEYSQDLSGLGTFTDGIHTRGMLGLALIFHPTLQDSYELSCEGLGEWKGEPAWLVHFRQKPDRPLRLQSFSVGGQRFSLSLNGRAWASATHFRILHIEADLIAPVPGIELRSEHQVAEYGPVQSKSKQIQLWLPKDTQTYMELRGRRYLLSDHFEDFILFSVDAQHQVKMPN